MSTQLQTPEFVYMNGKLTRWDDATIHIGCEAVTRGLNVFEGLKGYWQENGRYAIIFMERHFKRLLRSARLMHLPCPWTYEECEAAIHELAGRLLTREQDMWVRVTLLGIEGHWGQETRSDMVITAYQQSKERPLPISVGISTWRRSSDSSLPYRIKTSSNYQVARFARIEGSARGCEEMVLLNADGRVAEATGAAVVMVRDGVIYTPPSTEGALESITVDFIEDIANSMNIKFVRRPIDRTELLVADEIALAGTLSELIPVKAIDGFDIDPDGPVLSAVRKRFFDLVRGRSNDLEVEFSFVPENQICSRNV